MRERKCAVNWPSDVEQIKTEFVPWAPWLTPLERAKVAVVSTGGVYLKKGLHEPFGENDPSFREFPAVVVNDDLEVSPLVTYDPRYVKEDLNVVFPLERLTGLAAQGYVGAVAPFAYSFSGHTSALTPLLANFAPSLAYRMRRMGPDVVLVVATGAVEHQTAALVARAIELAGVPTVVLGTDRGVLEAVKAPRSVLVRHPEGAPLGNPGNAGKHQHLLREALEAAWQFEGSGLITELPHAWSGW